MVCDHYYSTRCHGFLFHIVTLHSLCFVLPVFVVSATLDYLCLPKYFNLCLVLFLGVTYQVVCVSFPVLCQFR